MSSNAFTAPGLLLAPSNPRSLPIPSPRYSWLPPHQSAEQDFSSNAASITPSRHALPVPSSTRQLSPISFDDDVGSTSTSSASPSGEEKKKKKKRAMDGAGKGAMRNRPSLRSQRLRAFHNDQPYPRQVSPPKPHKLPLELPPPTSPIRRRVFSRRNWLVRVLARFRRPSLLTHPTTYLALYFTLNLSLTLYNKSLLINFPFPYTLSALHAFCGSIGSYILVRSGSTPVPRLNAQETLVLLAFSGLYTINIIVSNVSLGLVTVPFHQVVRASTPFFTILFSSLILGTRSSREKLIALLPVVAGVGFATYGDYYFTAWGFFLTLFGTVLASLKTIYTNFLQTTTVPAPTTPKLTTPKRPLPSQALSSMRLPPLTPLHLLHLLSPLAFIQTTALAQLSGELGRLGDYIAAGVRHPATTGFAQGQPSPTPGMQLLLLLINGVMAFALNVVSFSANRKVGALSMTVAANVKQVLTILFAVTMFNLTITPMNAVGIVLTLVGGAVYASVELKERRARERVVR